MRTRKLENQAVGAYGEKAVECELLRRHWVPANVNSSVKNAAKYDIYAQKKDRGVLIRVRACGPGMKGFPCGGFSPGKAITTRGIQPNDFTVFVRMGEQRRDDQFFVVPTIVWREIAKRRSEHMKRRVKDIGSGT